MKQRLIMIMAVILTSLCLWGCSHDPDKLAPAATPKAADGAPIASEQPWAAKEPKSAGTVGAAPQLQINPNYQDKMGTKVKQ